MKKKTAKNEKEKDQDKINEVVADEFARDFIPKKTEVEIPAPDKLE